MAVTATSTTRMIVFGDPDVPLSRRMLATVRDLAARRGDIDVEHVDVWQDPDAAVAHGVLTVPTTIIFVAGEERKRLRGVRSARCLSRTIERVTARQLAERRAWLPAAPGLQVTSFGHTP